MGVRILSDLYPRVCERCGIDEDDPRGEQACASVESESPYHRFQKATPSEIVTICAWCPDARTLTAFYRSIGQLVSHGVCAACAAKQEIDAKLYDESKRGILSWAVVRRESV